MSDLAEFLLARIADDEAVARAASHLAPAGPDPAYVSPLDGLLRMQQRFGPARVLAECEAKRRIVAEWQQFWDSTSNDPVMGGWEGGLELAMKALALPYADHPDYREEWRPWQP